MVNFDRLFKTEAGKNIISIILGLGLASLFRQACNEKNCIYFQGPIIRDIEDKVFKSDGACYSYKAEHVNCDAAAQSNKRIVDITKDDDFYQAQKKLLAKQEEQKSQSDALFSTTASLFSSPSSTSSPSTSSTSSSSPAPSSSSPAPSSSSLSSSWDFLGTYNK